MPLLATTFKWWETGVNLLPAGFSRLSGSCLGAHPTMASHVFSEIFLHFNWHTDGDQPSISPTIESFVHNYIRNTCRQTPGVFFEGIGGTETHVHLAIRVEPHITPSEFIGALKGSSAFETNKQFKRTILTWQRGYGVASFSRSQLKFVLDYIKNQKEHHARNTLKPRLEATEQLPESRLKPADENN